MGVHILCKLFFYRGNLQNWARPAITIPVVRAMNMNGSDQPGNLFSKMIAKRFKADFQSLTDIVHFC